MLKTKIPVLLVAVITPLPALAYIDPGSGSAIISAIIGFIVALGLALKTYAYKIKSLFSRGAKNENNDEAQTEDETPKWTYCS